MSDEAMQIGRLISSVETLTSEVNQLRGQVDELRGQMNRGKGVFYGALFAAGGVGAGASHLLDVVFGR